MTQDKMNFSFDNRSRRDVGGWDVGGWVEGTENMGGRRWGRRETGLETESS